MADSQACERCHNDFKPKRKWQRFCKAKCRLDHFRETHAPTEANLRRMIREELIELLARDRPLLEELLAPNKAAELASQGDVSFTNSRPPTEPESTGPPPEA